MPKGLKTVSQIEIVRVFVTLYVRITWTLTNTKKWRATMNLFMKQINRPWWTRTVKKLCELFILNFIPSGYVWALVYFKFHTQGVRRASYVPRGSSCLIAIHVSLIAIHVNRIFWVVWSGGVGCGVGEARTIILHWPMYWTQKSMDFQFFNL